MGGEMTPQLMIIIDVFGLLFWLYSGNIAYDHDRKRLARFSYISVGVCFIMAAKRLADVIT
jgi:hypothetical protein